MAFAGDPFVPLVGNDRALEADKRHHAAQVEVDLLKLGKLLQSAGAHQAVVGMVIDDLGPHRVEKFVKPFGREALEKGIGIPLGTHAVNNLAAVAVGVHHCVHRVDVVLAVAVDRDCDIAAVFGFHQTGQHGVLVAAVAALADADVVRVAVCQLGDDLPCFILRTIVDKEHPAFGADFSGGSQICNFLQKHRRRDRQHGFFIVTGDDNIQNRGFTVVHGFTSS